MSKILLIFSIFFFLNFSIFPNSTDNKKKSNSAKLYGMDFKVSEKGSFIISYRGSPKIIGDLETDIEKFYSTQYSRFFPNPFTEKFSIILFKDQKEYTTKTKVPKDFMAHFEPKTKTILSYSNPFPGPIFHELIHAWLHCNLVANTRQLWFEEGFASYFESPEKHSEGNWIFDKPNWRMDSFKGNWTNLKLFMQSIDLRENHSKAEARLIFLWLSKNQLLEQFVKKYHENLDFDISGIDAIQEITGNNVEEIDSEIQKFKVEIENITGDSENKKKKTM